MEFWNWSEFWDEFIRIGAAALLGGALGFERGWKGRAAGLRTHMMVSIGCALFVLTALEVAGDQKEAVTRAIQGITAGIGFLGAGTILKLDRELEVVGLTTASSIWLAAALGTAAGLGAYMMAIVTVLISLFVLVVLGWVEDRFELEGEPEERKQLKRGNQKKTKSSRDEE
jgi:putative Mg2+ transporter-C (MgtC) family protein